MLNAKGSALRISDVSTFPHIERTGTPASPHSRPERQMPYTIQTLFRNAIR